MPHIDFHEAQTHLADLIAAVAKGEEIVITKDNQPVAKLVGMPLSKGRRQPGSAKGMIWMAEDFDAPLDDFKEYM